MVARYKFINEIETFLHLILPDPFGIFLNLTDGSASPQNLHLVSLFL